MTRSTVRRPPADPEFLSPEGERAWTWLRRHLDRANAFWLAFILTDDLTAQRVLRERLRANRRLHAHPLAVLQPATPAELAELLDELEARGAAPPGCTWVAAPQLADDEWLAAWRVFLLAMNHRRDVLRARLGGLVIAAPPAVKVVAQRQSPDLWSVRDLLIELAPRPVLSATAEPRFDPEPRRRVRAAGLSYESGDAELAEEAQVLLAMPVAELAGPARERVSRAVHRARARGDNQLAAVLLLAQSDGYSVAGDPAGALHLVQEGLALDGVEPRTQVRLLDSGAELATTISDLELARLYAADSVALTQRRVSPESPDTLRDFSISLNKLGDLARELGEPVTACTHYQQALDVARHLADQLDTPQALSELAWCLTKLGYATSELGDPATAVTYHRQALDIQQRLADQLGSSQALSDLAGGLTSLGHVTSDLGDPATAVTYHRQALDIRQRLADQLDTPSALRHLTWSRNDLGDITRELGDPVTAATHYQQALDVAQRLVQQLDTPRALRDLAVSLGKLGDITNELGDPATSATLLQQALDIAQRLAQQLDTPQALRDLSWILSLGNVTHDVGDPVTHHQQALDIRRRLAEQLDTPQARRDLAWTLHKLGDAARERGDPAVADTHYQQALDIHRRLAEQRGTTRALQDLWSGLNDLARTEEELGNSVVAAALRAELATVSDRLAALNDDTPHPPPD